MARDRATLTESTAKLHARELELRGREEAFRKQLDERIEERLRDARREIDSVVAALKAKTDTLASQAERRTAPLRAHSSRRFPPDSRNRPHGFVRAGRPALERALRHGEFFDKELRQAPVPLRPPSGRFTEPV